MRVANHFWDYVSRNHIEEHTKEFANNFVKSDMIQVFNYTLWHYEKDLNLTHLSGKMQ